MFTDLGPQPHLLDLDGSRTLSCHLHFLALLVAELPVVHDSAHGGIGIRGHLYQIHAHPSRFRQGLGNGQYPELLALEVDDPHVRDPDPLVDPKIFVYCTPPARWRYSPTEGMFRLAIRSGCTSPG